MTRLPDESISFQNTTGDSGIENLYVYGKFNYNFENDDLKVKSIVASESSTFKGDIIIEGNLTSTSGLNLTGDINIGGASGHVGLATFTDTRFYGKIFDGDGDFGTAGQLLSSDGTDLNWIDASTTSVANANNVGVNANSTNADQFITFVGASSGNNPIRVDTDLKYNPSTNTLKTSSGNLTLSSGGDVIVSDDLDVTGNLDASGNLDLGGNLKVDGQLKDGDGNFGTSGQVLSSDGTDTAWINAGSLTAGAAAEVGVSAASANANHFITMVDTASGNENIRVDTDLTYNPVTNTLNVPNISGNGSGLSGIEAFVTGMIILWSGAADAIPSGFVLCNGSNNTPDLRGRFVVGYADNDSDYDVNDTGGSKDNTLSVSQLPSHNHSFSGSASHNHTHTKATHPSGSGPEQNQSGGPEDRTNFGDTGTTSTATVTISGTTGNQGSGSAIENRPPYYALCYIMKT